MSRLFHLELYLYCLSFKDERAIQGQLPKVLLHMIGVPDGGMVEGIRRALVLVLISGTAIEQAPSVCPLFRMVAYCILDQH